MVALHLASVGEAMVFAEKAGVDAIKFQTFKAEKLVTVLAEKAKYQIKATGNNGFCCTSIIY